MILTKKDDLHVDEILNRENASLSSTKYMLNMF